MAVIIEEWQYKPDTIGVIHPVIYANGNPPRSSASISSALTAKLAAVSSPKMRSMKMESLLLSVVSQLPPDSVIEGIDVMFNPAYTIDVLAILKNVCKKHSFSVIWPGSYQDGMLYYAEEGFADYKQYSLGNYDVTCII